MFYEVLLEKKASTLDAARGMKRRAMMAVSPATRRKMHGDLLGGIREATPSTLPMRKIFPKHIEKKAGLFREATPEDKLRQQKIRNRFKGVAFSPRKATPADKARQQNVRNRFKNVAFMGRNKTAQRSAEGYDNEIADLRKQYKKHRRGKLMSVMTGRLGQRIYHGTKAGGYKKRMQALMDERERVHGRYK